MAYTVTLKSGVKDVILPNMQRYQAGATVILSDEETAQLSPTAAASLLTGAPAHVT